ncbi:deaminase domain-containing protein [Actinoallomurus sp. NPDC052274]|uniref:deaminase domain-containing protein n=1 Tax=Actinoallomurus sp. NPDC052274 TaxID=3155420 RepID=UPI003425012A
MENVVTADYKVSGKRGSLDAVTGPDNDDPDLAPVPSSPIFTPPPCAAGPDPSETHAEYKVIEAFVRLHPDRRVKGRLRMYSELFPCPACRDVIQQFLRAYPRMRLELGYSYDSAGTPIGEEMTEEFPPDPVNPRIELSFIEPPSE